MIQIYIFKVWWKEIVTRGALSAAMHAGVRNEGEHQNEQGAC